MTEQKRQVGTEEIQSVAYSDRRCINRRETIGYILYDASNNFNLNGQKETFVDSILGISFNLQSLFNTFGGAWDVVNDIIIGAIVDKTRTRWGKFRPYLLLIGLPLALFSAVYWLLPVVFEGSSSSYIPKFIAYAFFEIIMETSNTFRDVSKTGLISTITPYPVERSRLIAVTTYFCGWFSGLPSQIVEVLFDLVTNQIVTSVKYSSAELVKRAYVFMGPSTVLVAGFVALWFVKITRERVPQTEVAPSVRQSLKAVTSNKPVLIYILSEALAGFGTGISTNNYYKWVLFFGTMETVAGIPSAFVQPVGFAKVGKFQRKYSTKTLYMVSSCFAKSMYIPVFFYGMLGGKKNRFFTRVGPMMFITAVWEIIFATFYGVKSVTAVEIKNECMDYCEWKYGFRSEAMISVSKSVIQKIPSRLNGVIQPQIKKWIGYDAARYPKGQHQEYRTKFWIFTMATLFPAAICLISIIPMFFYDIDKKTREQMYYELITGRAEKSEEYDNKIEKNEP